MSDKISPVAVVVDGLNLFCLRYKVYLSVMVLTTLASLPMLGSGNNPEALFSATNLAAFGLSMLVTFFGYLVVFHDSLSFLRGEPRLLPPKFATRFLRLLWKSFLLLLMAMGPLAVTAIVMIIVASLWTGKMGEGMAGISFKVAAVLPMAYFGCRWGMALPAVAMGDESSFRLSWRMTRGHSSLLVLFFLPSIVLMAITQTVNRQDMLAGVFDPFSSTNLAFMGAGTVAFWFTIVMFIVWYEKLRLRYEAIRASEKATAAEFEFKEEA